MNNLLGLKKFFVVVIITFMGLTGCAFIHPTDPYSPVSYRTIPPLPVNPAPTPDRAPAISIQGPLTMEQAIQIALTNNPEIAATQWDVSAAGSSLDAARAQRWPTLKAVGDYGVYLDDQRLVQARYNGEPGIFDSEIYRGDLVLELPLFTGGRIISEIAASKLLKSAETQRLARTREELVFNVSSTFYAMLGQREAIRSLEFSTSAMEAQHRQVKALLSAQKAARVDLLRTEVRLADLKQRLVRKQNILAIEKRLLANLLGLEDDPELISIQGELVFEPFPVRSTETLLPDVLKRRSDYMGARAELEAQARRVDVAKAGHLPTLSFVGSYGGRVAGSGEDEDVGNAGVVLSVPIFEGGLTNARINQELARLSASRERLRKLELQIHLEVETAVLDIHSSRERIKANRSSVDQAEESLRIEQLKYNLGKGSITDVLDAQSAMLDSQTNFYQALADYGTAVALYRLAIGETH